MAKWTRQVIGTCCLAAVAAVAGCGSHSASPSPSGVVVTEDQSGQRITLSPGSTLEVRLISNPSAGFDWQITSPDSPVLGTPSSGFARSTSGAIGAAGTAWWKYTVQGRGTSTLRLEYRRSWEASTERVFSIEVDVR